MTGARSPFLSDGHSPVADPMDGDRPETRRRSDPAIRAEVLRQERRQIDAGSDFHCISPMGSGASGTAASAGGHLGMTLAGTPNTIAPAGTGRRTTALAPTTAPAPPGDVTEDADARADFGPVFDDRQELGFVGCRASAQPPRSCRGESERHCRSNGRSERSIRCARFGPAPDAGRSRNVYSPNPIDRREQQLVRHLGRAAQDRGPDLVDARSEPMNGHRPQTGLTQAATVGRKVLGQHLSQRKVVCRAFIRRGSR